MRAAVVFSKEGCCFSDSFFLNPLPILVEVFQFFFVKNFFKLSVSRMEKRVFFGRGRVLSHLLMKGIVGGKRVEKEVSVRF